MQATVFSYDETAGTGSVITDQGVVLPFGSDALLASGLRHLRPGQRLSVRTNATGPVEASGPVDASGPMDASDPDRATAITAFSLGTIVAD